MKSRLKRIGEFLNCLCMLFGVIAFSVNIRAARIALHTETEPAELSLDELIQTGARNNRYVKLDGFDFYHSDKWAAEIEYDKYSNTVTVPVFESDADTQDLSDVRVLLIYRNVRNWDVFTRKLSTTPPTGIVESLGDVSDRDLIEQYFPGLDSTRCLIVSADTHSENIFDSLMYVVGSWLLSVVSISISVISFLRTSIEDREAVRAQNANMPIHGFVQWLASKCVKLRLSPIQNTALLGLGAVTSAAISYLLAAPALLDYAPAGTKFYFGCNVAIATGILVVLTVYVAISAFKSLGKVGQDEPVTISSKEQIFEVLSRREHYKLDGGIRFVRFLGIAIYAIALCIGVGWGIDAFEGAFDRWSPVLPIAFALIAGAHLRGVLKWAHSRNMHLEISLGLICAVAMVVGRFEHRRVEVEGLRSVCDVSGFVPFMGHRLMTDLRGLPRHPGNVPAFGDCDFRDLLTAGMHLAAGILIPIMLLDRGIRTAYCPRCQRHMTASKLRFPKIPVEDLWQVIMSGDAVAFRETYQLLGAVGAEDEVAVQLRLEHCGNEVAPDCGCAVYATVAELDERGQERLQGSSFWKRESLQVQLTPEEVGAIARALRDNLAPNTSELAVPTCETRPAMPRWIGNWSMLPEAIRGRILAPEVMSWVGVRQKIVIGMINFGFLGSVVSLLGVFSYTTMAITMAICGVLISAIGIFLLWKSPSMGYLNRLAYKEISARRDAIVDPDDDSALLIEVVPRTNWAQPMPDNADEIGYLKIDKHRRRILFEGDKHRLDAPFEAIEGCDVEQFQPTYLTGVTLVYQKVVLQVRVESDVVELPMSIRRGQHARKVEVDFDVLRLQMLLKQAMCL